MKIVKVVRRGQNNSRVMLEDGTVLLVETPKAVIGEEVSCKLERKIDTLREMKNIRNALSGYLGKTSSGIPSYMNKDDLVQEIFLSMWEKNYWAKYDAKFGLSWESFIYTGVKNFMISLTNSSSNQGTFRTYSLNKKVSEDSGEEFGDFVASEVLDQEQVLDKMLIEQIRSRVSEAGDTGLPGMTFMDLFDAFMSGKKQSEISREYGWSETTLSSRKKVLQNIVADFI